MTALPDGVTLSTYHGIPVWRVQTAHASAAISQFGGQLLSWRPKGHSEVFWLTPTPLTAPKPIRGGVPVCWPYFARQGQSADVPQHGHARTSLWQLSHVQTDDESSITLQLDLPPQPDSPLRLRQQIQIGKQLQQQLISSHKGNGSQPPIMLTQAMHSYFHVACVRQVRVNGVADLDYLDNYDKTSYLQQGDWQLDDPRDPGRSDRLYQKTGKQFELIDPVAQRRISLHSQGSESLVIWNPGQAGAQAMSDVPDQDWPAFLCVEVANAGADIISLKSGQTHLLQQSISVTDM